MATGRVPTTANSPLTAKGDLFGYSTTQARVPVGSDGDTLVADSSTSTGLRWQGNFAAGKNKIINGDFAINQRNFTSSTASQAYNFDRFLTEYGGGTVTTSAQTFTAGAAPVSGYEARNFVRVVTAGQSSASDYTHYVQRIEDVRTFAGQTVTISFWAKAGSGTPSIAAEIRQAFGSGGSAGVFTPAGKVAITTSWARYSLTVAVPSISGKTIGTGEVFLALDLWLSAGSDYNTRSTSLGLQNGTIDLWGIQLEAGNTATAFQTATGTLAGELAAAMRYYQRYNIPVATGGTLVAGTAINTILFDTLIVPPVPFRVAPTAIDSLNLGIYYPPTSLTYNTGTFAINTFSTANAYSIRYTHGSGVFTAGVGGFITSTASNGYIGLTAEL